MIAIHVPAPAATSLIKTGVKETKKVQQQLKVCGFWLIASSTTMLLTF